MHRGFHLLWVAHLGLLLLAPKLLQERGFPEALHSWKKQQPAAVQGLSGLLMSPVLDLCSMAAVPSVWLPQVSKIPHLPPERSRAQQYLLKIGPISQSLHGCTFTVLDSGGRTWRPQRACALCAGEQRGWTSRQLRCAGALQPLLCGRALDGAAVPHRAAAWAAVHGVGVVLLRWAVASASRR